MEEKKAPVSEKNLSEREMYEQVLVTVNKDLFIKTLEECNKKMEENERSRELYLLDEKVFINAIYAQKDDTADKPWYKMMAAVEKVNEERVERIRKKRHIWVCGTFKNNSYMLFMLRMKRMFYYGDIGKLVKTIEEKRELADEQRDILKVIVCEIPVPHIHSYSDCLE